jgi:hypothetical protein
MQWIANDCEQRYACELLNRAQSSQSFFGQSGSAPNTARTASADVARRTASEAEIFDRRPVGKPVRKRLGVRREFACTIHNAMPNENAEDTFGQTQQAQAAFEGYMGRPMWTTCVRGKRPGEQDETQPPAGKKVQHPRKEKGDYRSILQHSSESEQNIRKTQKSDTGMIKHYLDSDKYQSKFEGMAGKPNFDSSAPRAKRYFMLERRSTKETGEAKMRPAKRLFAHNQQEENMGIVVDEPRDGFQSAGLDTGKLAKPEKIKRSFKQVFDAPSWSSGMQLGTVKWSQGQRNFKSAPPPPDRRGVRSFGVSKFASLGVGACLHQDDDRI